MIRIERAEEKDAERLHEIKVRAFDKEVEQHYGKSQSLAEYRNVETELELMAKYQVYKVLLGEKIIGCFLLDNFGLGKMKVEDFAIAPEYQGKGYGLEVFRQMEQMNPDVKEWSLSTLAFSVESQKLYEKAGYVEIRRDEEEVWYMKKN